MAEKYDHRGDAERIKQWQWKPGECGNKGGRSKVKDTFRKKCLKFVDEHVYDAWTKEVLSHGEKWLEASKLLAAYGVGIPKDAPPEETAEDEALPTAEEAAAAASELRELNQKLQ
jgi:hypothetical protein